MAKTTYVVGSKGTVLSWGKNSKCSHIPSVGKAQLSLAKTFCCCQQVLVSFVEVSADFAEVLSGLVSALCQGVTGSCGCWRTGGGPMAAQDTLLAWLPGVQEQHLAVGGDHRKGLVLSWSGLKCRAVPDGAHPVVCTLTSLFISHFLCPALLHNSHLITSFPVAPSFAISIPNFSALIPLPGSLWS